MPSTVVVPTDVIGNPSIAQRVRNSSPMTLRRS